MKYIVISPETIPVDLYVMYVLTSATDSFNIHTSLVWLDPSLSLSMHVNGNYNGNYHFCGIGLGHCILHYVIASCAAASLLYRRLKGAHWQGMPGSEWRNTCKRS